MAEVYLSNLRLQFMYRKAAFVSKEAGNTKQ
jgi:hypothetical protein